MLRERSQLLGLGISDDAWWLLMVAVSVVGLIVSVRKHWWCMMAADGGCVCGRSDGGRCLPTDWSKRKHNTAAEPVQQRSVGSSNPNPNPNPNLTCVSVCDYSRVYCMMFLSWLLLLTCYAYMYCPVWKMHAVCQWWQRLFMNVFLVGGLASEFS